MYSNTKAIQSTESESEVKQQLSTLVVGDLVVRNMLGLLQNLKITKMTDTQIVCGCWEFNKFTGGEIDDCMDYDGVNHCGSFIRPINI